MSITRVKTLYRVPVFVFMQGFVKSGFLIICYSTMSTTRTETYFLSPCTCFSPHAGLSRPVILKAKMRWFVVIGFAQQCPPPAWKHNFYLHVPVFVFMQGFVKSRIIVILLLNNVHHLYGDFILSPCTCFCLHISMFVVIGLSTSFFKIK